MPASERITSRSVHEAAHAVAAIKHGWRVGRVSILRGRGETTTRPGRTDPEATASDDRTDQATADGLIAMAGDAAERVILGDSVGGDSHDVATAIRAARRIIGGRDRKREKEFLDDWEEHATAFVKANQEAIVKVASWLESSGHLTGKQVRAILAGEDLDDQDDQDEQDTPDADGLGHDMPWCVTREGQVTFRGQPVPPQQRRPGDFAFECRDGITKRI